MTAISKVSIADSILKQAYSHPKFAGHLFREPSTCPKCMCEFVQIIKEDASRRIFWCNHCFSTFYADKKRVAA